MDQNTNLREYASRDWQVLEQQDRQHWLRQYRQFGPDATMGASWALWEHVRLVRPDWPTYHERQEDLEHHLKLQRIFQKVALILAAD